MMLNPKILAIVVLAVTCFYSTSWGQIRESAEQACSSKACYSTRAGRIYKSDLDMSNEHLMPLSAGFKSVLTFKGQLYGLTNTGKVYCWHETADDQMWVSIAAGVSKLKTDDKNLYIINKNRSLAYYDGSGFDFNSFDYDGQKTGIAENVFYSPGIKEVTALSSVQGVTNVIYRDGRTLPLFQKTQVQMTKEPIQPK